MHAHRLVAASALLTSLALGACSPPAAPQPEKPPAPQATAMSQAIHAPLNKAKAVEGQVQAAKDAQDKQIEADTQ
ncbi:hypothetical protein SAMN05428989_1891 [Pseudoxanthomonas sp. GM95]|uniref:hypothetical protein n=1 Tax=Pseudoxanthomonas sp. GM95 TaxID=1881043 RepID=UPI0008D3103E|nr:hypothetical protein [Pseudoxanthomonas sp. GM95]SEL54639.1 hypothetical protein SAMN05428989_1891 [Pseudoxanthomonas sp. GM95]